MAIYSKLVVDMDPSLYKDLCSLAHKRKTSRAAIVRGLLMSHLAEIETEPMTKTFVAPIKKPSKKK